MLVIAEHGLDGAGADGVVVIPRELAHHADEWVELGVVSGKRDSCRVLFFGRVFRRERS